MASPKGYSTTKLSDRLKAEFTTVEPVRDNQSALSTISHQFMREIGTDAVEAGSTTYVINATSHSARRGDVINFTSGTLDGYEVRVSEVATNTITLAEELPSAPSAADTFQILRHKSPVIDDNGIMSAKELTSSTATLSNVSSSASSVTILAANTSRLGATVFNDSTEVLYLKFGSTASSSSFTVKMLAGAYYEMPTPHVYVGVISGIWASANGSARVTELT
jgi:hypothetical protein